MARRFHLRPMSGTVITTLADAGVVLIVNEKKAGATDRSDPQGRLRLLERNAAIYRDVVPQSLQLHPPSPASLAASPPIADQSSSSPPWANKVRKRSRRRLASGNGTHNSSAAARVRRMSFWPRGAAKPAGENFLSAINAP